MSKRNEQKQRVKTINKNNQQKEIPEMMRERLLEAIQLREYDNSGLGRQAIPYYVHALEQGIARFTM